MKLNREQKHAVSHFTGPCVVTAVPGSGKTRVLTQRVVYLVKQKGISPKNILCTTFTNKAANEMKERIAAEIGECSNEIFINTFHGLSLAILRKYPHLAGLTNPFSIYTESDQIDLLAKVARMQGQEMRRDQIEYLARVVNDFRENTKNCQSYVEHLAPEEKDLLQEYQKILDELNAVDFSGILYKCWRILENPKLVEVLSNRFKFIMVDEAQDMNDIQYEITKRIGTHTNIFYVGDYHQSIFSWRGARPDNLHSLKKDFSTVTEITLPRNYRSTWDILRAAQRLIRNNDNAKNVVLISEKGDGNPVRVNMVLHDEAEADLVVDRIFKLSHRYPWKSFAVLYRTNHLSRIIEQKMRLSRIPYRIIGGFSFFDRREIKTALAYMQFLVNPFDTVSFARAMLEPKRGIGDAAIGRIEKYCHDKKVSVFDACKHIDEINGLLPRARQCVKDFIAIIKKHKQRDQAGEPIAKIAYDLMDEVGYLSYLKDITGKNDKERQRLDNMNELFSNMAEFNASIPYARINDYLQSVLVTTQDAQEGDDDKENAVSLLTMHSAKGLEFPVVFIIGCNERIIPHYRVTEERGIEEERRLMYVAMTRAQEYLFLSHKQVTRVLNKKTGQNTYIPAKPSMFLSEIFSNYQT